MEIRDPVHGSIAINDEEISILENPFFQRLRGIKQLGFSEYVFPGATHTRYLHSIGVMDVSTKAFNQVFKNQNLTKTELNRLKETVRLACLLHDIGHAPLSHSTESVMPALDTLKIPSPFNQTKNRQATHEDYTIKTITDSSLTESLAACEKSFGVKPNAVAELVLGKCFDEEYFTIKGINYFPILHQLVSSEMDCDRMDYLLRDSYFCGVSYGQFNLDWLIQNIKLCLVDNKAYLGISERVIATFDDFLLSRFHMFMMVYFHYRAVCLEQMLYRYFSSSPSEYTIPSAIDEYLQHNDAYLVNTLKQSNNKWAQRIILNSIPKKIFETFGEQELEKLMILENYIQNEDIDYIKCSSEGRISKYYSENNNQQLYPIKVIRESSLNGSITFIKNIHESTDLFEKYSKAHAVNRIHLDYEQLTSSQQKIIQEIIV